MCQSRNCLPASIQSKTNGHPLVLLYVQDGSKLYICGGYGRNHLGKWTTFPLVSQVDLPTLIEGVIHDCHIPAASILFASTPIVQSAGGELLKLPDNYFYLVMGHVFIGSYTAFEAQGEHNREAVSQTYLNEIRKLKIECASNSRLTVTLVQSYRDDNEFHRRDLNATEFVSPQGIGLAAYGGVFTPETQLSYSKPIYLIGNSPPFPDPRFDQKMNAYNCPRLLMYDKASQTMYTTFFGGISRHSWDSKVSAFVENPRIGAKSGSNYLDGMQWSDQISTIGKVMAPGREATFETVQPALLPGFLGTGGIFIPIPDIVRVHPGSATLDFAALAHKKTMVGYIYGGIRAFPYQFPYSKSGAPYNTGTVPTKPSDLILKVFVDPR